MAAVLAALGVPVTASGWLGADNDGVFTAAFAARGITDTMLRLPGSTRTNIKLADAERGDSTDINLPGLALAPEALAQAEADLLAALRAQVRPGDWCELAGSLPPGASADVWERLARALAAQGAHIAIDTGGAVLLQLLQCLADRARGSLVPVALVWLALHPAAMSSQASFWTSSEALWLVARCARWPRWPTPHRRCAAATACSTSWFRSVATAR